MECATPDAARLPAAGGAGAGAAPPPATEAKTLLFKTKTKTKDQKQGLPWKGEVAGRWFRLPFAAAPPRPPLPLTDLESADRRGVESPREHPGLLGVPWSRLQCARASARPPHHLRRPSRGTDLESAEGEATGPRGDTLACWVSPGHTFAALRHPLAPAPPSPPLPRTDLECAEGAAVSRGDTWLAGCPLDTPSVRYGTRPPHPLPPTGKSLVLGLWSRSEGARFRVC